MPAAASNYALNMLAQRVVYVLLALLTVASASAHTADSTQLRRKRAPANTTVEKIVSLPGQLAYAPLRYSVLGLGYAGVYMVETGVVSKIVNVVGGAGIVPVYAPRTGAGLRYTAANCGLSGADLVTTASSWLDGRQLFSVEWARVRLGAGFTSNAALRYRSLTEEVFYGIGPTSDKGNELYYSAEDVLLEISLQRELSRTLRARVDLGVSNTSIFDGKNTATPTITDVYSASTLAGLKDKNRFQGSEFALRYDDTNDPAHPTAGRLAKASATLFNDLHNDDLSFWKAGFDVTQHLHLIYDRTLVLRGAVEMTQALKGSRIPFYHLAELGSYGTLRGFSRGRFRDNDYVIGSVEYRYPVWIPWAKLVDAVVFVDGGQVAHDIFQDGSLGDWEVGYGGGFRFYNANALIAKTEVAFSDERYRIYFTLNTP